MLFDKVTIYWPFADQYETCLVLPYRIKSLWVLLEHTADQYEVYLVLCISVNLQLWILLEYIGYVTWFVGGVLVLDEVDTICTICVTTVILHAQFHFCIVNGQHGILLFHSLVL